MVKTTVLLLFLLSVLTACAPSIPTASPNGSPAAVDGANLNQTHADTFASLPSVTLAKTLLPTFEATPTPLQESGLVLVRNTQVGGTINGIAIVGDMAFVGMGPRVAVIDISQPDNPQLLGQSELLPGSVTQLLQIPSESAQLLLVNAGKYLVLINVSNSVELYPVHSLELAGAISALVWDARTSILYAGGSIYQAPEKYTGFISAVSINPDNHLTFINSVAMPEEPLSLALGKGSLFAGAQGYQGGLYHLQVKTTGELSSPHLVVPSTSTKPFQPTSMQVIGERLYISYLGVEAFDITNPEQPISVWTAGAGSMVVRDFDIVGEHIFIFGWTILSEYVQDVVNAPEPVKGSPLGKKASVAVIHEGDFLVAFQNLQIYDVVNSQDLQHIGGYQAPVTNAISAAVNEKVVFVVDIGNGDGGNRAVLHVLSLPDLMPLSLVVTDIPNNNHSFQGITLDNDRVYIAAEDRVWVYNVSQLEPILFGKLDVNGGDIEAITAITIAGKRLLFVAQNTPQANLLTVYDLTDVQKPALLGEPLALEKGEMVQMVWDDPLLFAILRPAIEYRSANLYSFDIDKNALALREALQVPGNMTSMAVDKKSIALAGSALFSIVSAVEPEPVRLLTQTTLPEYGLGVAMIKDKALVIVGDEYGAAQWLVYEMQDPANPRQIEVMDIAVSNLPRVSILVSKPYVILANGSGGVEVMNIGS